MLSSLSKLPVSKSTWLGSYSRYMAGIPNRKVFCVGYNKTGTTSIKFALQELGYRLGEQLDAELLIDDWSKRNFRSLISYCHHSDAFQDVPFSLDYTFQAMDAAFSGSKFILTIRDSAEQWYTSLTRFHTSRSVLGRLPTAEDLKNDPYVFKGWLWRVMELIFDINEERLYDEKLFKSCYLRHNDSITEYFRHRPDDLLVLNLSNPQAMKILYDFLGHPWQGEQMPHRNKSG